MVRADWTDEPLAYIGYGWESPDFYTRWMGDAELSEHLAGVAIEPMQQQSKYAEKCLQMVKTVLLSDTDYAERIKRHYSLMRKIVESR